MKLRAGQGLVRAYVERTAVLPHLRGRLDLAAQLRQPIPRPDAIPCEIDELTDDIAINQLPRAIAEWLVNHPQIDNLARSELSDAIRGFDRVSSRPIAEILKSIEQWPAVPDGYETLHRLCVLLVPPSVDGASFLINLERAFEDYVERGARRMSSGIHVLSQPTFSASHHGDSVLTFRPDLLICRNGDPLAIIDAKWKRLDGLPEPADVHQVIAYAAVARAPWAVLAYPGRRLSIRTYEFAGMPRSVVVIRLGLDGPTEALAQGFDRLARILRI
jgi:5-methylcytosine-specific restriction enzyme subunit McrC